MSKSSPDKYLKRSQIDLYYIKQLIIIYSQKCVPYVRLLANKSSSFKPDVRLVLLLKLLPFREWPHELKRCFMITKQAFIEDDLAEIENIL